jgi:3-dehydroquinate synthase
MKSIEVSTESRRYPIEIEWGALRRLGPLVARLGTPGKAVLLTDRNVWDACGRTAARSLEDAGFSVTPVVRPPGEEQKCLASAAEIYDVLVDARVDRKSLLIALGGGVVGDLGGFVASTFLRGIPYVQVPTSLLAQVDSSVGGKVAVNHPRAKNLIGSFYQPTGVVIDPSLLLTLPEPDRIAGMAEVIKYGIIRDATFFRFLLEHRETLRAISDPEAIEHIIARSCQIKADVVSKDERDSGLRNILNYGHTVGHALEAVDGFGHLRHGEVVAIGMVAAAMLSSKLSLAPPGLVEDHLAILSAYGLPTSCPIRDPDAVLATMRHDKKAVHDRLRFVLATEIGNVTMAEQVPDRLVHEVLVELARRSSGPD